MPRRDGRRFPEGNGHRPPAGWTRDLVALIERRPDLAGIGYADVALELAASA